MVESELESKYRANHFIILSFLERILTFEAAPLLWDISALRECQHLFYDVNPLKGGSLPCFQQQRDRVWMHIYRPWNVSTHTSFRGDSVGFKPPSPTRHYFQPLKCFLSLDTSGKFWKIPQEGDWAKRAPFLMPFRKHCTKHLPSKTAWSRNPTLRAGESW